LAVCYQAVTVCKSAPCATSLTPNGGDSEFWSLARELAKAGYTQIYNVRDGITRWIGEGNPVVKN